jgi:hypothetical protein
LKALLAIIVLILVLILVGWLRVGMPEGDPTIQVDKDKVKQDTERIVESAKRAIDQATDPDEREAAGTDDAPAPAHDAVSP